MDRFSDVILREKNESKQVKISSDDKPVLVSDIIEKWQSLIDTAAKIAEVPSGLIMRLNEKTIEVFLKSDTEGNPYKRGEQAKLIYGLYCETVIGTQEKMLIPDAREIPVWAKNNPDVDINMISYLGFPLNWPDGEVFGTVCLLDSKKNEYNENIEELLRQVKSHFENDLHRLVTNKELEKKNIQLGKLNNIKSRFLSLISHDIRGSIASIDEFLNLIIKNFDTYDKNRLKLILETLGQNASSSYQTLENLLSWSKSDFLELEPDRSQVDIIKTIDKILHYFSQLITVKGINVRKDYEQPKIYIQTDKNMITVILRNIISNAIKYNKQKGDLYIRVSAIDNKCQITIQDTGMGMSEQKLSKLFQYDSEDSDSLSHESAGIGLMLVREFMKKINISVDVKSEPDVGTTFSLTV